MQGKPPNLPELLGGSAGALPLSAGDDQPLTPTSSSPAPGRPAPSRRARWRPRGLRHAARRSRRVSAQQAVRRRHQRRARCTRFPWLDARSPGSTSTGSRSCISKGRDGTALDISTAPIRRAAHPARRVRSRARARGRAAPARGSSSGFEITQVERTPTGVTLQSRDGRTLRAPRVVAADGVHSVIAKRLGVNARWPRDEPRDRHDGRDAASTTLRAVAPGRGVGRLRVQRPRRLRLHLSEDASRQRRHRLPALALQGRGRASGRTTLQQQFVDVARRRAASSHGASDRKYFTPFLIPVGGPLPRRVARPRAVRRRRRRLRQRDHGRRHLLRDGVAANWPAARSSRRRDGADAGGAGRSTTSCGAREIGAELRDAVLIQRYLFASHERVARAGARRGRGRRR